MSFTVTTDHASRPVAVIGAGTLGRRTALMFATRCECLELVAEGVATPQDIDGMFRVNTGLKGGPFRLMDQVGLDVVLDIEEHYAAEHPEYPDAPRVLLRDHISGGRLGVKSGEGFYDDHAKV